MEKIAIAIVAYNRKESLSRLLSSLSNAQFDGDKVPLIISVDKSETDEVEVFAGNYKWEYGPKTVVLHSENLGLRRHVLEQGKILDSYDAVVVLEDDLVVSPYFWYFTKQTVAKYNNVDAIAGISLYSFAINYHLRHPFIPESKGHDVYFMNCAMSWGQIWMSSQWKDFEKWYADNMDFKPSPYIPDSLYRWGEKSWLRYHTRYCAEKNKYFVFPYISYTTNFSESGVHFCNRDNIYQVSLMSGYIKEYRLPDFGDNVVKYDVFFENKALYAALNLSELNCCLDLSGANDNKAGKRYWLTIKRLPYAVVREFDFSCRPIEKNVLIGNIDGTGIYLYDTSKSERKIKNTGNPVFLSNHFVQNGFLFVREYGLSNIIRDLLKVIKVKL